MAKKYLLGIDIGGSKAEFVVADIELHVVQRVYIPRGANPWCVGIEATLAIIDEGLGRLAHYRADIVQVVAGVAGCFVYNGYKHQFARQIEVHLQQFCDHSIQVGDLPTSFRAATTSASGILAIAGSSSCIAAFFRDGQQSVQDAVGIGGRDLGFLVASAYQRGHLGTPEAARFVARHVHRLQESRLRTAADFYFSDELRHLATHIAALDLCSAEFAGLHPLVGMVIDRWRHKLFSMVRRYRMREPGKVTLVLNGSFWKYEYLRHEVISSLQLDIGTGLHIIHDPLLPPVMGALRLAQEAYQQRQGVVVKNNERTMVDPTGLEPVTSAV